MKCYQEVNCPNCRCSTIMKSGKNAQGIQRYCRKNSACPTQTFMLDYRYNGCVLGIKEKVVEMAINSSGIRDTARVLKINKNTVHQYPEK